MSGLVLVPLVCIGSLALLPPSYGETVALTRASTSAAIPASPLFLARETLLASCCLGLRRALAASGEGLRTLETVNDFFNQVPVRSRVARPGTEESWATPVEFLSGKGGVAADFVVAKYFTLRDIGVPAGRLRVFVVGRNGLPQPHYVLAYYPAPDAQPLILDNFDTAVRSAAERSDIVPVYSFDPDTGAAHGGHRKWREMAGRMKE